MNDKDKSDVLAEESIGVMLMLYSTEGKPVQYHEMEKSCQWTDLKSLLARAVRSGIIEEVDTGYRLTKDGMEIMEGHLASA